MKSPYTFRIKPGSELEEVLDIILSGDEDGNLTISRFAYELGYDKAAPRTAYYLAQFSDNFAMNKSSASYVDVVPQTTIVQEAETVVGQAPTHQPYNGPSVLWPEVPMIGDTADMPWFRKPSWYGRMEAMIKAGKNISLAGPPGIGKSSAVEYLAAEQGQVLVNISADAGLRRRDLTGNVELVNSHTQFQVALYLAAVKCGWWVKIDEVNAAEPDALMYLNSQIAPPYSANFYGKSISRHPDFRLFITYNPGLVGTKPLPPAFKDRFFPIKLDFPTEFALRQMLTANGMPEADWANAIVKFGLAAWERHTQGRMRYQITPRRLMDAVDLVKLAELDVFDALEQAVVQAVDNLAEAKVLKETLKETKEAQLFGRL